MSEQRLKHRAAASEIYDAIRWREAQGARPGVQDSALTELASRVRALLTSIQFDAWVLPDDAQPILDDLWQCVYGGEQPGDQRLTRALQLVGKHYRPLPDWQQGVHARISRESRGIRSWPRRAWRWLSW